MRHQLVSVAVCVVALLGSGPHVWAADQEADRAAIEASVKSYVSAFNARDTKALAAHWAPNAVYINPLTKSQVEGPEAIAKEFEAMLAALGETKLAIDIESIQFISPSVAVETGIARLVSTKGTPEQSTYTAIHVKRDERWLLDRVTEEELPVVLSNYEHLKDLEWMIGTWVDEDGPDRVETACRRTQNRNFITRSFTVTVADRADQTGMQVIGWDPAEKRIRSWIFDSDGGFGEGRWSKDGERWSVTTTSTLPDGRKASCVNVITRVDDDQFKWQSVSRVVDGEVLPNIDEVFVVRRRETD